MHSNALRNEIYTFRSVAKLHLQIEMQRTHKNEYMRRLSDMTAEFVSAYDKRP